MYVAFTPGIYYLQWKIIASLAILLIYFTKIRIDQKIFDSINETDVCRREYLSDSEVTPDTTCY